MSERKIDFLAAISLVVANMVGTGVFTSLGFQLLSLQEGFTIVLLWSIGGLVALCGAVAYAELATRMPEDGGEYYFLSKIYHPSFGFMAGFVSATVGFSAPIAAAAFALGKYSGALFGGAVDPIWIGAVVVVVIGLIHTLNLKAGVQFQKVFTLIKVAIIAIFIVAGLMGGNQTGINFQQSGAAWDEIFTSSFAVSLVYVSYAYSGWNASAYLAGEIKNPAKNLSRSIFWGTLAVTLMYVLINAVFLMAAPKAEMVVDTTGSAAFAPKEVGIIASKYIFNHWVGNAMGIVISLLLVSTISAMIIAGPRVMQPMFAKLPPFKVLGSTDKRGNPVMAIVFQTMLALVILFSASFDQVIQYIAFTLTLFTTLTVMGLFITRYKYGRPTGYKALGYPITPILFIAVNIYVAIFQFKTQSGPSLLGMSTALLGGLLYYISTDYREKKKAGISAEKKES